MTEQISAGSLRKSVAYITTPNASKYLQQLCKHFAHKPPVTFDERSGQVTFTIGECDLSAEAGALKISLTAADNERMAQLRDVVARHLVRFAFREELIFNWRPA